MSENSAKAKVAKLEQLQARMVAANKCVRKKDRGGLLALGFTEGQVDELFKPDFCGRLGFADYELTNNSANMRRIRQRIEQLQHAATRPEASDVVREGVRIVENADLNRLQLFFPGKPSEAIRSNLKRHGFRWSPSEGAWQRQLPTRPAMPRDTC